LAPVSLGEAGTSHVDDDLLTGCGAAGGDVNRVTRDLDVRLAELGLGGNQLDHLVPKSLSPVHHRLTRSILVEVDDGHRFRVGGGDLSSDSSKSQTEVARRDGSRRTHGFMDSIGCSHAGSRRHVLACREVKWLYARTKGT